MKGVPADKFLSELRKDPELAKAMDENKEWLSKKREELGEEAYYDWLLGSMIKVEKMKIQTVQIEWHEGSPATDGEHLIQFASGYTAQRYWYLEDAVDDYGQIKRWANPIEYKPNAISPEKGEPMPQTREYWEKRAMLDQELILEQKAEISKLKQRINKLEQESY